MIKKQKIDKIIQESIKELLKEEIQNEQKKQKSLYLTYRFPKLRESLISLMTPSFPRFINDIQIISPKPTTFRVFLRNDMNFILYYDKKEFTAEILGKKYDLSRENSTNMACQALSYLFSLNKIQEDNPEGEEFSNFSNNSSSGTAFSGSIPDIDVGEFDNLDDKSSNIDLEDTPDETEPPDDEGEELDLDL